MAINGKPPYPTRVSLSFFFFFFFLFLYIFDVTNDDVDDGSRVLHRCAGIEADGTVPGSIYTDLEKADIFTGGPLLFRFNDLDYRWVSYEDWDYSLTFQGSIYNHPSTLIALHLRLCTTAQLQRI